MGCTRDLLASVRIKPVFAWYDLWIGAYWDRDTRRLYLMVLTIGVVFEFERGDE